MSGDDDYFANLAAPVLRYSPPTKEELIEPSSLPERPKRLTMAKPAKDDPVAVAAAALEKVPYERLAEFWVLVSPEKKRGIELMGFK